MGGLEFSLIIATIRLINAGVLDRHPDLTIHMPHLGGGMASMLGAELPGQGVPGGGTTGNPRHGVVPEHDAGHYLRERIVFDTAGFCGTPGTLRTALVERRDCRQALDPAARGGNDARTFRP